MSSKASRLPSRFPVGTRYIIEGSGGHIHVRYLEFPDGRQIQLPADLAERSEHHRYGPVRARARQRTPARKF
jgi:hypothetical protein